MDKQVRDLLKELSFEVCVGCPHEAECNQKISNPIQCKKMDLINNIVAVLREKS